MPRPGKYDRVSHEDPHRFDFEARISSEAPRTKRDSFDVDGEDGAHSGCSSPTLLEKGSAHGKDSDDFSDDEIGTLMAEDPLHNPSAQKVKSKTRGERRADRADRRALRKVRRRARKVARKLRGRGGLKAVLLGFVFIAFAAGVICFIVGLLQHQHTDQNNQHTAVKSTEEPSSEQHPVLPEGVNPKPIMPVPVQAPVAPATVHEDAFSDPPELSAEAIAQAQGINGDLQEAQAAQVAAAAAAADAAAHAKADKFGLDAALASLQENMETMWAWMTAKWDDVFSNTRTHRGKPN